MGLGLHNDGVEHVQVHSVARLHGVPKRIVEMTRMN